MTGLVARGIDGLIEASVVGSFTRLGPSARSRLFGWHDAPTGVLTGRTALVTGATSGIGAAVAAGLVDLGATGHLLGRDEQRLTQVTDGLRNRRPGAAVIGHRVDLGRLVEVRDLAEHLRGDVAQHDIMDNVAGALTQEQEVTEDGIELTMQVHVVAPFLLTAALLSPLRASSDARVITMSSGGMYTQRLDLGDLLDPPEPFDGTVTYARAKRAQVELDVEWARRLRGAGIGFHTMHPGWVDTPGLQAGLPGFAKVISPLLRTPEQGADTAVWLAWTPDAHAPGGAFWLDRKQRHTIALPWTRTPEGERERVWEAVRHLADIDPTAFEPFAERDQDPS